MKTKNLILSGVFFLGLVAFSSCDDSSSVVESLDNSLDTDVIEQQEAIEDAVESVFDDIEATLSTDFEMSSTTQLKSASEDEMPVGCPAVIIEHPEDTTYPKVITYDYGTENCEDRHGILKRGKVIVTKTGPHWEAGSERTVVFEDFYVNDNSIVGSRTFQNEGQNEDGNWYFSVNIDVTVETTEEITWTHQVSRIRTLIAGADTPRYPWDDQFLITGTSSGSSSLGYSVTREITTPVLKKKDCRFPVSGMVEIVRTKDGVSAKAWLDYGEGECDYKATVTDEDGNVEEILLGKRFKCRR